VPASTTQGTSTSTAPTTTASSPSDSPSSTAPQTLTPTAAPTHDSSRAALATATASLEGTLGTPDVPYIADGVLHIAGRTVTLDLGDDQLGGQAFGPLAEGRLAVSVWNAKDQWSLRFLDSAGGLVRTVPGTTAAVANSEGTRIAYTDDDGGMRLVDTTGREIARRAGDFMAVGVIGDTVYGSDLSKDEMTSVAWDTRADTLTTLAPGRLYSVHQGTSSGLFVSSPLTPQNCTRLVAVDGAELTTRWTACGDVVPGLFSRSGAHLLSHGGGLDGGDPHNLQVMRASDARVVLEVDGDANGLMLTQAIVNDAGNAVTVTAQDAALNQALVRCSLVDGSCRPVTPKRKIDTSTPSGIGVNPYVPLQLP
jgi:hypothetical protein